MELRGQEESTSEILAALAADGERITVEQMERWRQAGLIPAACRRSRGGRGGMDWLHPAGTVDRVRALVSLRPRAIGLAEAAIRLWLAGFDLDEEVVRRALLHIIDRHRKARARLSPRRDAERFGDGLARNERMRRRWGATSRPAEMSVTLAAENVMRALVENRPLDRHEAKGVSSLFAHDDAEREALGAFTLDFTGEVVAAFDFLRIAPEVVDEAIWADLCIARSAVPQFGELVRQLSAAPPSVMRDVFLRQLRAITEPSSVLLIIMLLLRRRLVTDKPMAAPAAHHEIVDMAEM